MKLRSKKLEARASAMRRRNRRRTNVTTGVCAESSALSPNLVPISESIAELDARFPWLAVVTRENWQRLGFEPTARIQGLHLSSPTEPPPLP